MDAQEARPDFMILEEEIAEDDEGIVIDWYLDYSFHNMKRTMYWKWIFMWHVSDNSISPLV